MAAALLALLTQGAPNIQTRKALLLTGLQNDFLSPEGKLPISTASGFLDRVRHLVPAFREHGDVIWVRSHFQETRDANRDDTVSDHVIAGSAAQFEDSDSKDRRDDSKGSPVPTKKARLSNEATERPVTARELMQRIEFGYPGVTELQDEDEELFLTETPKKEPCCIPGSFGAEYAEQIKDLVDSKKDIEVIKTYYSAFGSTSLLLTLRSRLITELFICGCVTNLSVFATAMDAARYGIKVTLVEDCLGYRRKARHEQAMKQLHEIMEANILTSHKVIERLENPQASSDEEGDDDEDGDELYEDSEEEVAVGEDADGLPEDLLEADSGDEEDFEKPLVRPLYTSTRPLPLRYASLTTQGLLNPPTAGSKSNSPVEPTESSGARSADAYGAADDGRDTASIEPSTDRRYGKRKNNLEHGFNGSASSKSVDDDGADDESSTRVVSRRPWVDAIIDKSQTVFGKTSHTVSGTSTHPGLNAMSALLGLNQSTVDDMEKTAEARLHTPQEIPDLRAMPLFGEDKGEESNGSRISFELLPPDVADTIFSELNEEVTWQRMHHQTGEVPRLVCCQGTIEDDGSMPVYRHPSDQTLPIESWTPAVNKVRKAAEQVVGHPLNHSLIQLYRSGTDFISEHSDKTLDIVKDTCIVNVSFGAQRTMRLRTKRVIAPSTSTPDPNTSGRTTYRVPMPHNSMITMSLTTNAEYLHGINADKRPSIELNEAEKAYDGQRISLTFRNIGTFLSKDSSRIWGQGAIGKTREEANAVINADATESEKLVRAFGSENQSSKIDWDAIYGDGFDVLHLK